MDYPIGRPPAVPYNEYSESTLSNTSFAPQSEKRLLIMPDQTPQRGTPNLLASVLVAVALALVAISGAAPQPAHARAADSPSEVSVCGSVSEIPTAECEALEALYNSTGGGSWSNNTGWLATTTPCSWHGVTCVDNHVTKVALPSNSLSGSLPTQLGNLTALQELRLGNNNLTGEIPTSLGSLSNLSVLFLENNQLSGSIPGALSTLPLLQSLNLSFNNLSGSIPSDIGSASSLGYLLLQSNQLDGEIPASLGSLSSMCHLELQNNGLEGDIPSSITNLTSLGIVLCEVDFGYNRLTASDANVVTFLEGDGSPENPGKDPDWSLTQTITPTNFAISNITATSVDLSWTPITYTGDTGYYVIGQSTSSGGPYTDVTQTVNKSTSGITVTGLTSGTAYYFVVKSYTAAHGDQLNNLTSAPSTELTNYSGACYTLTLAASPSEQGSVAADVDPNCDGKYTAGTVVNVTATPGDGYTFANWGGSASGSDNPLAVTMDADKSITGNFGEPCYTLTLSHSGNGGDPVASPTNSASCGAGQYVEGESISLTASPDSGWQVASWTGTDNNASTSNSNSLTMPASAHAASVTYEENAVTCYALTFSHTGNGADPTASPTNSDGCPAGEYVEGESLSLTASPDSGWGVASWGGTDNNASTSASNSATMPASAHEVSVAYEQRIELVFPLITLTDTTPRYKWTEVPGATGYNLWVLYIEDGRKVWRKTYATRICNDNGICAVTPQRAQGHGDYKWMVTAYMDGGGEVTSDWGFYSIDAPTPELIGPFGDITDTTPRYRWTVAENATAYELLVTRTSNGAEVWRKTYATRICDAGRCAVTPGLTIPRTAYTYKVQAIKTVGSVWSDPGQFTIK